MTHIHIHTLKHHHLNTDRLRKDENVNATNLGNVSLYKFIYMILFCCNAGEQDYRSPVNINTCSVWRLYTFADKEPERNNNSSRSRH